LKLIPGTRVLFSAVRPVGTRRPGSALENQSKSGKTYLRNCCVAGIRASTSTSISRKTARLPIGRRADSDVRASYQSGSAHHTTRGAQRIGWRSKNPNAPAVKREAEEDWGRW